MPIYEYKCNDCETPVEFVTVKIPDEFPEYFECACGGKAKRVFSVPGEPNFGFRQYETEHITGENILVESRQHKRQLLRENGLEEAA
jgi:putative FmdB family regulatory protein